MSTNIEVKNFYHPNGKIKRAEHYQDGVLHKEDGPALIEFNEQGEEIRAVWYNHGIVHRNVFPAVEVERGIDRSYYQDGVNVPLRNQDGTPNEVMNAKFPLEQHLPLLELAVGNKDIADALIVEMLSNLRTPKPGNNIASKLGDPE
jgi:hypothetical protein